MSLNCPPTQEVRMIDSDCADKLRSRKNAHDRKQLRGLHIGIHRAHSVNRKLSTGVDNRGMNKEAGAFCAIAL